jgi:hypothetical protein
LKSCLLIKRRLINSSSILCDWYHVIFLTIFRGYCTAIDCLRLISCYKFPLTCIFNRLLLLLMDWWSQRVYFTLFGRRFIHAKQSLRLFGSSSRLFVLLYFLLWLDFLKISDWWNLVRSRISWGLSHVCHYDCLFLLYCSVF